jgi:hypothetical protein
MVNRLMFISEAFLPLSWARVVKPDSDDVSAAAIAPKHDAIKHSPYINNIILFK